MNRYWTEHDPSGEAGEFAIRDLQVMVRYRQRDDATAEVMTLDGCSNSGVGVPGAKNGEAVMLFVTRMNPDLTEKNVRDVCNADRTERKKPKYVAFADEMLNTKAGNIWRRELRDTAIKQMNA